ncbi:MmcQ/YjbR family DNA-binding protein [Pseudomonas sp. HK3]|jgi:predicted DNA-binding protein (MmcQ/YjbR family)
MTFDQCCEYLASKPEAQLSFPFDQDVHVYKVCNKMFALISSTGNKTPNNPNQVAQMNLKCDPFHAQELRDVFSAVIPGYHMNKKHWNTLILDDTLPESEIKRLIDHSYALVSSKLTRAQKVPLELKYSKEALYRALNPFE